MASTSKPPPKDAEARKDVHRPPASHEHQRGWRQGDPKSAAAVPGQEYGAAGGKEDGPDVSAGAGSPSGGPGGRGTSPPAGR
jgi:hypothetical protein